MIGEKQVGPYMGVSFDKTVNHGSSTFRIITYQAFNAQGLIGSEYNGIAILDEDKMEIIVDNIACGPSGYFGVTAAQNAEAERISNMSFSDLSDLVNSSSRARRTLSGVAMKPWTVIKHSEESGYSVQHLTGPIDSSSAFPFFQEKATEEGHTVVVILAGSHEAHVASDETERQA
jgi:hypothetical protein